MNNRVEREINLFKNQIVKIKSSCCEVDGEVLFNSLKYVERMLDVLSAHSIMSDIEKERLLNHQIWDEDVSHLRSIKDKYDLTWNEIKYLVRISKNN